MSPEIFSSITVAFIPKIEENLDVDEMKEILFILLDKVYENPLPKVKIMFKNRSKDFGLMGYIFEICYCYSDLDTHENFKVLNSLFKFDEIETDSFRTEIVVK